MGNTCTYRSYRSVGKPREQMLKEGVWSSSPNLFSGADTAADTASTGRSSHFFENDHGVVKPENDHRNINYVHRTLKNAKKEAKKKKKPIFCLKIGENERHEFHSGALNHPLIIEAVETLFVPVKIDLPPGEESWDTPDSTIMEVLDKNGKLLVPAIRDDQLRKRNLVLVVDVLVKGLEISKKPVPPYLKLMLEEESGKTEVLSTGKQRKVDRVAFFGVSDCRLTEAKFSEINGVLEVDICLYKEQHVLRVRYASRVVSLGALMKQALSENLAKTIYYQSHEEMILARMTCEQLQRSSHIIVKMEDPNLAQPTSDGRSGIRSTPLKNVPMTDLQKLQANKLVNEGNFREAMMLLSARQSARMNKSFSDSSRRESIDLDLVESWWS